MFLKKIKPALVALCIYVLLLALRLLFKSCFDDSVWYKNMLLYTFSLSEKIALICIAIALLYRIKYMGTIITSILMTINLLIAVESGYCIVYEWKHRPGNEENLKKEKEEAEREKEKNKPPAKPRPVIIDPVPTAKNIQPIDLFEITDSEKVFGEPEFRKEEAAWGDRQVEDEKMGFENKPNSKVEDKTWTFGKKNPTAFYTIDSLGRRVTGRVVNDRSNKKFAAFFGCSIMFGLHVDDDQTLPAFFEAIDTNYISYNYAVSGYGAHHQLALFENKNIRNEIPEKEGVGIYTYFIGHVSRAIGDMDSYNGWNASSPYYYLSYGEVKRNKNFKTGRWFVSWFYDFFSKTYMCKYHDMHLPGKLRPWHYELTSKIIEKASNEYAKQFGNNNFYVVLLPGYDADEIKPYLEKLNLKIIDCTNLVNSNWDDKYHFRADGHPRPLFFEILAEAVYNAIKQNN